MIRHVAALLLLGSETLLGAQAAVTRSPAGPRSLAQTCTRIASETGSRIASIHRSERAENALKMLAAFGRCLPAGRGAWALSLDRVTDSDGGPYGQWSLIHIAADGSTAAVAPSIPSSDTRSERWDPRDKVDSKGNFDFTVGILLHLAPPVVFDYDGDGKAEIVLQVGSQISEGGTWEHGRVWTARGGTVHLYEPARNLLAHAVRDVDGDGRPDLLIHRPYSLVVNGPIDTDELTGPELLAHALPGGGFSTSDPVAAATARVSCPQRPAALVVRQSDLSYDVVTTATNVACARLWGIPREQVEAEIRRDCKFVKTRELDMTNCEFQSDFLKWARLPPPLTLRPR